MGRLGDVIYIPCDFDEEETDAVHHTHFHDLEAAQERCDALNTSDSAYLWRVRAFRPAYDVPGCIYPVDVDGYEP